MGVDIARHGADHTVIRFRRGLDARSIPAIKFRIPDLMEVGKRSPNLSITHNSCSDRGAQRDVGEA